MDKVLTNEVIEEVLNSKLPRTSQIQKCSFILPDGKFFKINEHYDAYKYLVLDDLVSCIPDAEQLLGELGYIQYSWVGFITLTDKVPTQEQYKSLNLVLKEISKYRDVISIQIQSRPKFYVNFELNNIPYIIEKIKYYYNYGELV